MNAPFESDAVSHGNVDLPASFRLDNTFARLPGKFFTHLAPAGFPEPHMVAVSEEACALIGLEASAFHSAIATRDSTPLTELFAGNRHIPGSKPLAAVYSGHQFGVWAGQLGDGRAHTLGDADGPAGRWELQLKGAGRTPYSRMGDGRAVLRSSIREFLCSEAMAGLGIPTTRALCLVASSMPVRRETIETAAIVTRMAPSFIRFGTFEHWFSHQDTESLKTLLEHVVTHHMPELPSASESTDKLALALLREVSRRTADLLAHWQAVGFMHGVMNTDNMSILGLTLDYGPFGFMEAFEAGHVCNHSDHNGRYAFHAQPQVAYWNLYALGSALLPLVEDEDAVKDAIDSSYLDRYHQNFMRHMRSKLGFDQLLDGDEAFINDLFGLLQSQRPDYTLFFRVLSGLDGIARPADSALRDLFVDRIACDAWLQGWRARLAVEERADEERRQQMLKVNPGYVLRNYLAEQAIEAARDGNYEEIASLMKCLKRPYDEQPEFARYARLPPDWASGLEVSCSS